METNKRITELKHMYKYVKIVCCVVTDRRYEGVKLDSKWQTFDDFVKDNWIRYYRAVVKWRGYKKVVKRKGRSDKLIINHIKFKRKNKSEGYTRENTVFTSASDSMKYYNTTHKYMFEGSLLGTRDIKNILKKRGIKLSMVMIVERLKKGRDLFDPSVEKKIRWKGAYRDFIEIAKMENVSYDVLKKSYYSKGSIKSAVDRARNIKPLVKYDFEGQKLLGSEISKVIATRVGLSHSTVYARFKKHGLNLEKLSAIKHQKKFDKT